jgi:hypothetical protein
MSTIEGTDERVDPSALTPEQLARVLRASRARMATAATVHDDIDDGAPTNADGTLNLVHYVAWLVRELARAE